MSKPMNPICRPRNAQRLRSLLALALIVPLIGCAKSGLEIGEDGILYSESGAPLGRVSGGDEEGGPEEARLRGEGAGGDPEEADGETLNSDFLSETDQDAQRKKDIYWKLAALKEPLTSGLLPYAFPQILAELQAQARETMDDEKRQLAEEILSHLQDGLEADKTERMFRQGGVDSAALPWGIGRLAMESRLNGWDGFADVSSPSGLGESIDRAALRQEVLDYEDRHHASPERVKREAWRQAAVKTDQLGEMLGLLGKEPPSDAVARSSRR